MLAGMLRALAVIVVATAGCSEPLPVTAVLTGRDADELHETTFARPGVPATAQAWATRQGELRAALRRTMRIPYPRTVPAVTVVGTRTVDGVIIEDLLVDGFDGTHIP